MTYMGARKQLPVVFHLMIFSTALKPKILTREKRFNQSPGDQPERGRSSAYR